jgi:hypothetical protein
MTRLIPVRRGKSRPVFRGRVGAPDRMRRGRRHSRQLAAVQLPSPVIGTCDAHHNECGLDVAAIIKSAIRCDGRHNTVDFRPLSLR